MSDALNQNLLDQPASRPTASHQTASHRTGSPRSCHSLQVLAAKMLGYAQWGVMGGAMFAERLAPALGYELSPEMLQVASFRLVCPLPRVAPAKASPQASRMMYLSPYLQGLKDKRLGIIAGAWFAGNMLSNSLLSTGAFEVYYDGQLVRPNALLPAIGRTLDVL